MQRRQFSKQEGTLLVLSSRVAEGTVFFALEPAQGHRQAIVRRGRRWGYIRSRPMQEGYTVALHYMHVEALSYQAILRVHPWLADVDHRQKDGEITVYDTSSTPVDTLISEQ